MIEIWGSETLGAVLLGATFIFFNFQVSKSNKSDLVTDWPAYLLAARASNISFFRSFIDKLIIFFA